MSKPTLSTAAAQCARRIREIYATDLVEDAGVLHVAAVGRDEHGRLHSIAIMPQAPRSATDTFLLRLARARADAIVATGRILRREPGLTHEPLAEQSGLAAWRREVRHEPNAPLSVVLTRGRALRLDHPLFAAATRAVIFTSAAAAKRLGAGRRQNLEVVAAAEPTLRAALRWLRAERDCTSIDVEAGPSTTGALYDEPLAVDELMLSIYEERILSPALRAGRFTDEERLRALFVEPAPPFVAREESGRWAFHRFVRRAARG